MKAAMMSVRARDRRLQQEAALSQNGYISSLVVAVVLLASASPAVSQKAADAASIWDANHDGVYTCDEWKKYLERLFVIADRNRDGMLDATEFKTIRQASPPLAEADFGYFDENQDGKISRQEFVSKPSELILQYDKNGDCRVTPDEMKESAEPPKSPVGGKRR
jgi:Ca2+-binding EF-hand superfamily protein